MCRFINYDRNYTHIYDCLSVGRSVCHTFDFFVSRAPPPPPPQTCDNLQKALFHRWCRPRRRVYICIYRQGYQLYQLMRTRRYKYPRGALCVHRYSCVSKCERSVTVRFLRIRRPQNSVTCIMYTIRRPVGPFLKVLVDEDRVFIVFS